MTQEEFEQVVREGIEAVPKRFLDKLDNVDICIEEKPTSYQLGKLRSRGNFLIFGLYEGVPQTKRRHYAQVLPDRITIFKEPIEKVARSKEAIKKIVRNTVWHEIAHHFGMDEKRVRETEKQRRR